MRSYLYKVHASINLTAAVWWFIILQPVLAMATSRELLPLEGAKSGISLTIFSKYVGVFLLKTFSSTVNRLATVVYRPCLFCLLIFMKYRDSIVIVTIYSLSIVIMIV